MSRRPRVFLDITGRFDKIAAGAKVREHDPLETIVVAERAYVAALRRVTAEIGRATNRHLVDRMDKIVDERTDSPGPGFQGRLNRSMTEIRREVSDRFPAEALDAITEAQVDRIQKASRETWLLTVSRSTGISQRRLLQLADDTLDPESFEDLSPAEQAAALMLVGGLERGESRRDAAAWIRANKKLIRSLTTEHTDKVRQKVASAAIAGVGLVALRKLAREQSAETQRRGDLIAEDQTQKGVGSLQESRAAAVGAGDYIWRTQLDDRVRDEHAAREGLPFTWDNPPDDGHPGEPVNCRCYAEPVVPGDISDDPDDARDRFVGSDSDGIASKIGELRRGL